MHTMKRQTILLALSMLGLVFAGFLINGFLSIRLVQAQTQDSERRGQNQNEPGTQYSFPERRPAAVQTRIVTEPRLGAFFNPSATRAPGEMAAALAALQENVGDEDARAKLTELLGSQFDEDLENRKQRITQLQQQIDELRSQIAKREDAKERIIELRIELMLNEADGLGFPSNWNSNGVARFPTRANSNYGQPQWLPGAANAPFAPARINTGDPQERDER